MFMAFTAPLAPHAFTLSHINGDAFAAVGLISFALLIVATAWTGSRVPYRYSLDTGHRGQIEPTFERIIAPGGPVSAMRAPVRTANGRYRDPISGKFVKAPR